MFETFQEFCMKPLAVPAAVFSAAESAGWTTLPPDQAAGLARALPNVGGKLEARMSAADKRVLLAGEATYPLADKPIKVNICAVVGGPPPGESLTPEVAAYAAVPKTPMAKPDDMLSMYPFTDDAGHHGKIDNADDDRVLRPLIESGRLRAVFVAEQPGLAIVGLAVPLK
jgi:hypothetical protein